MDIAILGPAGMPASPRGFQSGVEQIISRLTDRGHDVTVHVPAARESRLPAFLLALVATVRVARAPKPDVALFYTAATGPLCLITRAAGIPTLIDLDGLDSSPPRPHRFARGCLRMAERLAPRMAHRAITDSYASADAYARRYGREIEVVPYRDDGRQPVDWESVTAAYEQLLRVVSRGTGHGPLPMDQLEQLERLPRSQR